MKFSGLVLAAMMPLPLSICDPTPPPALVTDSAIRDRIALCGAGIERGLSVEVTAKVGTSLQELGELDAEALQVLRAAFFEGSDPSDPTVAASFQRYVTCVEAV